MQHELAKLTTKMNTAVQKEYYRETISRLMSFAVFVNHHSDLFLYILFRLIGIKYIGLKRLSIKFSNELSVVMDNFCKLLYILMSSLFN